MTESSPFCVSYSYELDATSPHTDWIARCRPRCAAFTYGKNGYPNDTSASAWYTYMPHDGFIEILLNFPWFEIDALLRIQVDEEAKSVCVIEAMCERYCTYADEGDEDQWDGNCWFGNLNFFRKQLRILGSWPLDDAVKCMFGQSWTAVVGEGDASIAKKVAARFRPLKNLLCPDNDVNTYFGKYIDKYKYKNIKKICGMYDLSLEINAATKIQAAYRGWKARMMYRFDPHTTLGQYYVNHMFREMADASIKNDILMMYTFEAS